MLLAETMFGVTKNFLLKIGIVETCEAFTWIFLS